MELLDQSKLGTLLNSRKYRNLPGGDKNRILAHLTAENARRAAQAIGDRLLSEAARPKSKSTVQRKFGSVSAKGKGQSQAGASSSSYSSGPGIVFGAARPSPPQRVRVEGLMKLTNTAINVCDTYLRVALDDGTGGVSGTIASYCARLATHKAIYRRYKLRSVEIQWVPSVSDTTEGIVAVCYDTDIRLGALVNTNNVMLRPNHFMCPLRMPGGKLRFVPKAAVDKEERYVATATSGGTTRSVEETQYGTIAVVAENALANGATIGYLRMVVEVDFSDPI